MTGPLAPSAPIHVASLAARNGWRRELIGTSAEGVAIHAWWPTMARPTRVVWAAIHGEEVVTAQLANHVLRTVHADDACAVVVPVLNPDGVLLGTRQNARGVDLNRNFPGANWLPDVAPTFWPTATVRTSERRTQWSSPGLEPGSEPETRAIMQLVRDVEPEAVIDWHTPLECVIAARAESVALGEHLAEPTGIRVVRELDGPTPGDSATWCAEQGAMVATYELELAPLPVLWARHQEGLVRSVVERRGR